MMQMNELNRNSACLIHLISCALCEREAEDSVLDGVDSGSLFLLAKRHSVSAMVCMVLEKTEVFAGFSPALKQQWLEAKNKAVRKSMLLDAEREVLMDEMEHAGIWHMPLKGSVLKDWYPQFGMREMADNDILFDSEKREAVKELFLKHGYTVEGYEKGNHDVYKKPPIYNFEMHVSLFSEMAYAELAQKYEGVKDRLLPDDNKKYRFHFSSEDFYVFAVAHAHKHFSNSGTGIRTLSDIYVMNQKLGSSMDRNYVERELLRLGILDFERRSRALAEKIFGSEKWISEISLTEEEKEMLEYYMGSCTYGTIENGVANRLHSMQKGNAPIRGITKFRYFIKRLFPGRQWCKQTYPFIYRHPYLLPAFWIWRIVKQVPTRRKEIRRELSALKASDK